MALMPPEAGSSPVAVVGTIDGDVKVSFKTSVRSPGMVFISHLVGAVGDREAVGPVKRVFRRPNCRPVVGHDC